ncbi:hypothetical protein EV182_006374 [Spiromyces aspiralis]|uniref:Uncharacterized protein n=1 Tax=Spiromyces aspiralis TaxID=68401 RepID=A0ACC1H8Z8_9FUNG|nr:hypothetical protein EV182_006374 [Spiromyces aspiralis]
MFFNPDPQVLGDILSDQVHGINVVYAILTGKGIEDSEKIRIAHVVQQTLQSYLHQGVQSYHRLYEIAAEIIRQGGNGILNGGGIAYGGIIGAMPGYANGMSATVGLPGAHTPTSYHPHHPLQIQQPHQQAVSYPYGGLALNTAGISGGYTYGVHAMPGTAQQVMVPPGSSIRTGFISPMEGHLPASMSVSDGVHHHQLAPDLPALSTITATSGIVNPALEDNHYEQRPVMVATRAGSNEPQ